MIFRVEYTKATARQLKEMDRKTAAFILAYIEDKLVNCVNPRLQGKVLHGILKDTWRYWVGDYRIMAKIEDDILVITIIAIGHRQDIYSKIYNRKETIISDTE